MTSAWVAVAARPASRDRRPTRTNRACRAALPPRRSRPAQRRPAGRGLSVVRRRRQGVLGTCSSILGSTARLLSVRRGGAIARLRVRTDADGSGILAGYTIAQPSSLGDRPTTVLCNDA